MVSPAPFGTDAQARPRGAEVGPGWPPGSVPLAPKAGPNLTLVVIAVGVVAALVIGGAVAFLLLPGAQRGSPYNPPTFNQRSFPLTVEVNITRSLLITDPSGTPVSYSLHLSPANSIAGEQRIIAFANSPPPTDESSVWWWNGTVPAGGSDNIEVRYHALMTTRVWDIAQADVATTAEVGSAYSKYLDDEWVIDADAPAVLNLTSQLTTESRNYLQQLEDLYAGMLSRFTYQATASFEPQTPGETAARQGGDADDFSVLFVSMARHLGIPAWLELGLLYDDIRDLWGAHAWAKVFIPLKNGSGVEATVDVVNKLFLIRDPYRLTEWSSDGDAQHLMDFYTLMTYAPATSPPLSVSSTITHDRFVAQGVVQYLHP